MREKVKSIILALLFINVLFFTWQLYFNGLYSVSFRPRQIEEVDDLIPSKIESWIKPKRTIVHFSEDDHGVFYDTQKYPFWTYSLKYLKDQSIKKENFVLETIEEDKVIKMKNQFSVTYEFNYYMNEMFISSVFNIPGLNFISENGIVFNKLTFLVSKGDIIFEGEKENYILKLNGEDIESIRRLANQVIEDGYVRYYPGIFLGSEKEIFSPISMNQEIGNFYTKQEIDIEDDKTVDLYASKFFVQPIDMIRKIEDSEGNRIYMYEHSQLIVESDGLVKFYNTFSENVTTRDFKKGLEVAAKFILEKETNTENTFLDKYILISDEQGNLGYRFFINYYYDEYPIIMHKNGNQIVYPYVIDVYGEKVQNFNRYVREKAIKELPQIGIMDKERMTPLEVIELNLDRVEEIYTISNQAEKYEKVLDLNNIEKIYFSYYDNCNGNKLVPIWVIEIADVNYAFDMYSGRIIFKQILKKELK